MGWSCAPRPADEWLDENWPRRDRNGRERDANAQSGNPIDDVCHEVEVRSGHELGGNPIGWCSEDKHGSTDLTFVSDVYDLEEASPSSRPRCDRVFMLVPTDGTIKGCKFDEWAATGEVAAT